MQIDKTKIIAALRARGLQDRADWVDRELPPMVDAYEHGALLRMLGIDPDTMAPAEVPPG